jgi:hypothetical protein
MVKAGRTRPATHDEARVRLRAGAAYLEVAELVLEEPDRLEMPGRRHLTARNWQRPSFDSSI